MKPIPIKIKYQAVFIKRRIKKITATTGLFEVITNILEKIAPKDNNSKSKDKILIFFNNIILYTHAAAPRYRAIFRKVYLPLLPHRNKDSLYFTSYILYLSYKNF